MNAPEGMAKILTMGESTFFDSATLCKVTKLALCERTFGANHFISKIPFDSSCWIVWDKDNGGTDFADCELAWTSFNTAVRKVKHKWAGMLQENMKIKEKRIHPTQKPVTLYRWILDNYAKESDKILDTHVGSGSSRIACYMAGLEFVGFELDKDYYDAQEKRFTDFKSQLRIDFK